jgi:hypothetical protein
MINEWLWNEKLSDEVLEFLKTEIKYVNDEMADLKKHWIEVEKAT